MRDIKFRAWSKSDNKYYYRVLVGNTDETDSQYVCSSIHNGDSWVHFDKHCGVIEQYTGLKDKNGREIYEGDIVSVRDSPVAVEDEEGVCYVAWSSVLAGFILKGSDAYKFDEQSLSDLKLIIIGNIHENPELLEEK